VSGISIRAPGGCNNMEELGEALLAGKDLVTSDDRRWPPGNNKGFAWIHFAESMN
jgi:acyl transferase domain-containing protein